MVKQVISVLMIAGGLYGVATCQMALRGDTSHWHGFEVNLMWAWTVVDAIAVLLGLWLATWSFKGKP